MGEVLQEAQDVELEVDQKLYRQPRRSEWLFRGRLSGYVSSSIRFDLFLAAPFVYFSILTYAAPALHKIRQLSGSVLLVFTLMYYILPV